MKHIHEPDSLYFSMCEVGCYNIIYVHDCDIYCPDCLKEAIENKEEFTLPIEGSDSFMNDEISRCTNWKSIDMYCSVCNENLPCEYGETYETMVEFINNIDETSNEDDIEKSIEYLNILNKNGYSDFVWDQLIGKI